MSRERRLGRGLEALLGRSFDSGSSSDDSQQLGIYQESSAATTGGDGQQWLEIQSIEANPYQPRQHFDEAEIADLCDSIRTHGFLQPIVVRPCGERYQIIAGERRLRAAQLANWQSVPVLVRQVDDRQMAELAIVENVQRKDLNALEKAASFQRYLLQYGCTQEELAARVNIDRSTVANLIRLLELPEDVKRMVAEGAISPGHARALLPLGDDQEQCQFARQIARESLSVRATEQMVHDHIHQSDVEPLSLVDTDGTSRPVQRPVAQHLLQIEEQLKLALGTKVDLKQGAKGRGKITIHFGSHEEFDRLRAILSGGGSGSFPEAI